MIKWVEPAEGSRYTAKRNMEHAIEVTYDRRLIRRALNKFMTKKLGWLTLALMLALGIFLVAQLVLDRWSGWLALMSFLWLLLFGMLAFVYWARLRASEGFFQKSENSTVQFVFTEEGIRTNSDVGTSDLKWKVFDEVLKFSDLWLLIYAKSGYMTLPTEKLTDQIRNLIESKISKKAV